MNWGLTELDIHCLPVGGLLMAGSCSLLSVSLMSEQPTSMNSTPLSWDWVCAAWVQTGSTGEHESCSGSMGEGGVDFQWVLLRFALEGTFLTQSWTNCAFQSASRSLKRIKQSCVVKHEHTQEPHDCSIRCHWEKELPIDLYFDLSVLLMPCTTPALVPPGTHQPLKHHYHSFTRMYIFLTWCWYACLLRNFDALESKEIRAACSRMKVRHWSMPWTFIVASSETFCAQGKQRPSQIFGLFASWTGYCAGLQIPLILHTLLKRTNHGPCPYWVPRNASFLCTQWYQQSCKHTSLDPSLWVIILHSSCINWSCQPTKTGATSRV